MKSLTLNTWKKAVLLALPLAAAQVVISQAQSEFGLSPISAAYAQQEGQKKERETQRTPALRNKVYEKLAEAQAAAEAKDLATASSILDGMIASGGKKALNSYELANVYNLYAFIHYSRCHRLVTFRNEFHYILIQIFVYFKHSSIVGGTTHHLGAQKNKQKTRRYAISQM